MKTYLIRYLLSAALLAGTASIVHAEAQVGEPAPDFTLTGHDGKSYSLSDFEGQYVVLEWLNHGCPFVKKHYNSGNMQELQSEFTDKGVAWLSICSSAPGKQGYMSVSETARKAQEVNSEATAVLIDDSGKVGQQYGARRTPEMFIINPQGEIIYHGAIDSNPSPDPATINGATNYVSLVLNKAKAGEAIPTQRTKPYGCSVKY